MLHQVLAITFPLSQTLQKASHDLVSATSDIKAILGVVEAMRNDVVTSFITVWALAQQLAQSVDVALAMPRIIGRGKQVHRSNVQCVTAEEYYRTNLYIPFLDHIITQMTLRFSAQFEVIRQLSSLVPGFCGFSTTRPCQLSDISETVSFYSSLIDPDRVEHELQTWNVKWFGNTFSSTETDRIHADNLPATALDALEQCNQHFYPNIHRLLTILATLPVTTASAERSFSTLRRLKTYLRSTMSSERLTSIALLNIHPDIPCPVEEVINRFASDCRRLNLNL